MSDEAVLKERYLRDAIPIRLGNMASSLKRLGYFVVLNKYDETVLQLIQECWLFSSWTCPEVNLETKTELDALQGDLKTWESNFQTSNEDEHWRAQIFSACERWANRLLDLSGLLKTGLPSR